jgi:coenzyme F420-0:L-glutamate ligase / coenzyme F420-1:gamma-L-glutamate ligase
MEDMIIQPACLTSPGLADLIRERRSVRSFQDRGVSRELVAGVLREAVWAPSPHNSQPWRFTVLFEHPDKECLAKAMAEQLASELEADGCAKDTIARQTERSLRRISTAPVIVLCSLARAGLVTYSDQRRADLEFRMAVQSVGAVLQTIFLLAHAAGLGSCWMAAPMYCPEVVRSTLTLPAEFEPQALVLLGHPAAPSKIRARRPFEEAVELR